MTAGLGHSPPAPACQPHTPTSRPAVTAAAESPCRCTPVAGTADSAPTQRLCNCPLGLQLLLLLLPFPAVFPCPFWAHQTPSLLPDNSTYNNVTTSGVGPQSAAHLMGGMGGGSSFPQLTKHISGVSVSLRGVAGRGCAGAQLRAAAHKKDGVN